ncbi:hydrogenase expression/formation protein HypE [Fundidesulfovibrio butyratiphilus]
MGKKILLDYGSGGLASQRLVAEVFVKHLSNAFLARMDDAALVKLNGPVAVSTDSFTVDPIFFPGGDIGCLAVHGTVNDVAMMGARPRYLTCGFILEEGFEFDDLERIVASMAQAARHAGVKVVAGDTKVVPRGMADKIFINTTGLGEVVAKPAPGGRRARPGDVVLLSGTVGDHGLTVLSCRQGLGLDAPVRSDCASLNHVVLKLLRAGVRPRVLRDPTRGGLATTLNEIALQSGVGVEIEESAVPVDPAVASGCEILGLDPLYLANEGKFLCVVEPGQAEKALGILHMDKLGRRACAIGRITAENAGKVALRTSLGGRRLLGMLEGEQLPRIC